MSDPQDDLDNSLPLLLARHIERVCDEFSAELRAGKEPRIEDFLGRVAESGRTALLCELIVTELEVLSDQGRRLNTEAYYARFPHDQPAVTAAFGRLKVMAEAPREAASPAAAAARTASHNLLFGIIALQNDLVV